MKPGWRTAVFCLPSTYEYPDQGEATHFQGVSPVNHAQAGPVHSGCLVWTDPFELTLVFPHEFKKTNQLMTDSTVASHLTDVRFDSLNLHPDILASLKSAGFERLTPIQALTLPPALDGKDIAGQAQTGTGKTAAFLLVVFQQLMNNPRPESDGQDHPRALILAPTRELAIQIKRDADQLCQATNLRIGLAYGGVDYDKQAEEIRSGIDILVGTPGRIIDYYKKRVFSFKHCNMMVLDEADRMFDLGFIKDIRYVFRQLPPREERQNLMFSATLDYKVTELAYVHMNEPEMLKVEAEQITAENVHQQVLYPANPEKLPLLVKILNDLKEGAGDDGRIMVFCNMRVTTDRVNDTLKANGINSGVMSGRVHQRKRQTLLKSFHDGDLRVLVATDVAARGLHIPDVTHVINYDLPQDAEDYVHRIGRTARLGAHGEAISFACEDYAFHLPDVESYIGYPVPVDDFDHENLPEIKRAPPRKRSNKRHHKGGGRGRRR